MPRKPPPNAFYYYMKEIQNEMKERGQRVPSMKEMPALVSPQWNRLTPEEKAPYEEMTRAYKRNRANTDDGRLTSDGIPVQILKQQEEEAAELVRANEAAIRNLIANTDITELASSSFFIMGFNILVGTLEELYLPNEIGIVEYSIRDGIKNEFHKFIDPGSIPIGYTSAAKNNSEAVHEIPISGFALATSNYTKLYQEIRCFLGLEAQASSETRYVFCHPLENSQFQRCLGWLKENACFDENEKIVFGNLATLVWELKNAVGQKYPFKSSAADAITSNSFDYSPNTLCHFHEQKDNKNCALGYCKRLSYILSDILCKPYQIDVTSKHFPERLAAAETTEWEPRREIRPVFNKTDVPFKPVVPHIPSTIVSNIRSMFDDEETYSITPSALSETSSVVSESVHFDDDEFPSLTRNMSNISLPPSRPVSTTTTSGPSWAAVSSRQPQQMRMPKGTAQSAKQCMNMASTAPPLNVGLGRGVGMGRGVGRGGRN